MRIAYLVLLGTVVGGWFLAEHRHSLGRAVRQALVWGLIFLGVIAAVGLWSDVRDQVMPRQSYIAGEGVIEVPRAFDGHYYLTLQVNGTPVDFVVDTGATEIVLSQRDAVRAGIDPRALDYFGRAQTANGAVAIAEVRLDELRLGDITDRGVRASVSQGQMGGSLLGMSYLQRFDRIEIADDELVLER